MKEPPAPRPRKRCSRKLKIVCSFGGSFRPCPPTGAPRYAGGETRVVSVDRGIGLSGLRAKIADLWPHLPSFSVTLQLRVSNGAATSPVPAASEADVARMVDAYDKMEAYGAGRLCCRLWVLVFAEERFDLGGCERSEDGLGIDRQFGISVKELARSRSELGLSSRDRSHRVYALDEHSPIWSRLRSERVRSSVNPIPLTPRDQNLNVEAIGGKKIEGQLLSDVNREKVVPRSTLEDSINSSAARNDSAGNIVPTKSPESGLSGTHSAVKSNLSHKRNGDVLKNGESVKMACPRVYNIPCEGSARIVSSCLNDRDPDVLHCQSIHESLTTNCESTCSKSNEAKLPISDASSTEMPDAQIKPGAKLMELMELNVASLFDNTNGMIRSDSHSPAIPGTGKESSAVDEKTSMIEESCKHSKSKASCGNQTDLPAPYSNLATTELQAIKASDLEYLKELGAGTYGTVYHGKWKGSDVAIKKLRPCCFAGSSPDKDRLVADFWKEAHILGQLHHPNIVAFYGVVTDGPVTNLATVTEYMVNGSLKQVLNRKDRTIDRRKRVIIARDAAFGMEYLHGKNIVHFDLKSHNFLVNMRDPLRPVCKIGDLGLSKIKQRTLVSGGVRGTVPWMAPELFSCEKNNMVTEKIDVYSFGIVMWELLTGEEPYANMRSQDIIAGIVTGSLRPEIPTWCDPTWRSLMERCWSSDPNSRPSFAEVAKELCAMSATMNIK